MACDVPEDPLRSPEHRRARAHDALEDVDRGAGDQELRRAGGAPRRTRLPIVLRGDEASTDGAPRRLALSAGCRSIVQKSETGGRARS